MKIKPPPEWHALGLCREVDPELWFPEKGGTAAPAKKICDGCDVKAECLQWGLDNRIRFGVLGGKTPRERRQILIDAGIDPDVDPEDDDSDEDVAA